VDKGFIERAAVEQGGDDSLAYIKCKCMRGMDERRKAVASMFVM